MRHTLAVSALLAAYSAPAVTLTSFDFTGDWRDGIGADFIGANGLNNTEIEIAGPPFARALGTGESETSPVNVNMFAEEPSPGVGGVNLVFSWFFDTGAENEWTAIVPDGWTATPTLTYDPQTFAGNLSWGFAFTPTPETPWSPALLGIGVLCLGAAVRRPQRQ